MFKVTKRNIGELVGLCDNIRYITYDANSGTFCQAFGADDADGIAIGGNPYNIGNEEKIPGADFVDIDEIDNGEYHFQTNNQVVKSAGEIADMQGLILEQDNTICIMQEAIMEIDNQMNGGE